MARPPAREEASLERGRGEHLARVEKRSPVHARRSMVTVSTVRGSRPASGHRTSGTPRVATRYRGRASGVRRRADRPPRHPPRGAAGHGTAEDHLGAQRDRGRRRRERGTHHQERGQVAVGCAVVLTSTRRSRIPPPPRGARARSCHGTPGRRSVPIRPIWPVNNPMPMRTATSGRYHSGVDTSLLTTDRRHTYGGPHESDSQSVTSSLLIVGCGRGSGRRGPREDREVVASFYPLAFAPSAPAARGFPSGTHQPGVEPHDSSHTDDLEAIARPMSWCTCGFQSVVEDAVEAEATGITVDA